MEKVKLFRYDGSIFNGLKDYFVEMKEEEEEEENGLRWFKKEDDGVVREIKRITKEYLYRNNINEDDIKKVITDPLTYKHNKGKYPLGFSVWCLETDNLFKLEILDVEIEDFITSERKKEKEYFLAKKIN